MKLRNFRDLIEKHLTKEKIAEIEAQVIFELNALESLQKNISDALESYMKNNNLDFDELTKRLNFTPRQLAKIQQGKANLTLACVAHIATMLGQEPSIIFKKK